MYQKYNIQPLKGKILYNKGGFPAFRKGPYAEIGEVIATDVTIGHYRRFTDYIKQLQLVSKDMAAIHCDSTTLKMIFDDFSALEFERQLTVLLDKSGINTNSPHIINSPTLRQRLSNFLTTVKGIFL